MQKRTFSLIVNFLLIFCCLLFNMPAFSATNNTIFIKDLKKDQVQKAIIEKSIKTNWQVKKADNYTLDIYRIKDDPASMALYGTSLNMHPEERVHFTMVEEKNGVKLSHNTNIAINPNSVYENLKYTPLLDFAVESMLKDLFFGSYSYHVKYKIKKDYVLLSDSPLTNYENNSIRIGQKFKKVIQINDKNINEYEKEELKTLFNSCQNDKIKLKILDDTSENLILYLLRTYKAPEYKQYL